MSLARAVPAALLVLSLAAVAPAPLAAVTARVTLDMAEGGAPVVEARRYFALVPIDRPWAEPAVEAAVAPGRRGPVWEIPPGSYRPLCVASDYAVAYGAPAELAAGETVDLVCPALRLVAAEALVVAASDGSPIADARVVPARELLSGGALDLSALGRDVAGERTEVSDSEGSISLRGPAGRGIDLWVDAPGFSPRLLAGWSVDAVESGPLVVALEPGGELRLTLTGPAPVPAPRLSLRRVDSGRASNAPAPRRALGAGAWERPFEGSSEIVWDALPPGRYEVLLAAAGGWWPVGAPVTVLGQVDVIAEETTTLEIAALPNRSPPRQGGSGVRMVVPPVEAEALEAARIVLVDGERFERPAAWARRVAGGWRIEAPGECAAGSVAVFETEIAIAEPVRLAEGCAEGDGAPLRGLVQAATVTGRVRAPGDLDLPSGGRLGLAHCAEEGGWERAPRVAHPLSIDSAGAWRATVPAGCHRANLDIGDFALEELGEIELAAGTSATLKERLLTYGGSLLAPVLGPAGVPVAEAVVELFPETARSRAARGAFEGRLGGGLVRTTTDIDGWARLARAASGTYLVRIMAEGYAPFLSRSIELPGGEDVVVDPLRLPAPAAIEIDLKFASRALSRDMDRFTVSLLAERSSEFAGEQLGREFATRPPLRVSSVPPGEWIVAVAAVNAEEEITPLGSKRVEVAPGETVRVILTPQHGIFRGRVLRSGRPVAHARLYIRPDQPDGRSHVSAATDDAGDFTVAVEPGLYGVTIISIGDGLTTTVPEVTFEDPEERVEIEVPGGAISGIVVDVEGWPIEKASVEATRVGTAGPAPAALGPRVIQTLAEVKAGGVFEFDALASGEWTLEALSEKGTSEPLSLVLAPDELRPGVRLVIEPRKPFVGRVLGPAGEPVAGVHGWMNWARGAVGRLPGQGRFTTDAAGRFEIASGPQPGVEVNVQLSAPGYPAVALRTDSGAEATLWLPASGGPVELVFDADQRSTPPVFWALVAPDGAFLQLHLVGARSRETGDGALRLTVPSLAAGRWRLVRIDSAATYGGLVAGLGGALPAVGVVTAEALPAAGAGPD